MASVAGDGAVVMGEDCDCSATSEARSIKESWSSDLDADLGEVGESTLREFVTDLCELRRDGGTRTREGGGGEPKTQKLVIILVLALCPSGRSRLVKYWTTSKCEV